MLAARVCVCRGRGRGDSNPAGAVRPVVCCRHHRATDAPVGERRLGAAVTVEVTAAAVVAAAVGLSEV